MISLKKREQGFTIVELLIVIVVIGILALLVITTYAGIQSKARDSKRQTDLKSLQTQIEAFFSQNGYYPSNADLNLPSWRTSNMKSLDAQALVDPSSTSNTCSAGTQTSCLADNNATSFIKQYRYFPQDVNNSSANCEATDTTCSQYVLTAGFENSVGGKTFETLNNLD
ncbi:MAG TPA: prepilin-type N-terminal cleavage/methylation domain-containing protein [Patescibacteria group bacterium]|nr:prepilin-type N-terminal cleavage/methylation domain-containing protein [Patescibacteria group bacterium]